MILPTVPCARSAGQCGDAVVPHPLGSRSPHRVHARCCSPRRTARAHRATVARQRGREALRWRGATG